MDTSSHLELSRNANDVQGLDILRQAAKNGDKEALEEAAKQFEGIFVQMMLKSMRKAQDVLVDKDSPFNSEQVKFYRDMHDKQLANDLANKGSIGLADIIVRQLGQLGDGYMPAGAMRSDGDISSINRNRVEEIQHAQQQVVSANEIKSFDSFKSQAFSNAQSFIEQLYPVAEEAARRLGIEPKALLAQAALETGWGQHMIHTNEGRNTHNLFGIKANKAWQGDRALVDTVEVEQGVAKTQKAPFRVYAGFDDSMQDYVNFVQQNPRYQQAVLKTSEPEVYFNELQKAGYATDPKYAEKIMSVLKSDVLVGFKP